jgi:hypothetical protein
MTLDIRQPGFWDLRDLDGELRRVYDICAGRPLAALQISQGTGTPARHPIRVLAEAYGLPVEE